MNTDTFVSIALNSGAAKATIISSDKIVLSEKFREICESNQCGNYGSCWMCPPYIGEIQDLMAQVKKYSSALLYQTIFHIRDSFDIERMFAAGAEHTKVSQSIQRNIASILPPDSLHLSCGGCHLCDICAKKDHLPCRMPHKALASLEGYGIDVYQTVKGTPLKYTNGVNTVTYFGLLLFSV